MKVLKLLSCALILAMLASLCVLPAGAADTAYQSLTEIPMKSWIMLGPSTSEDAEPEYEPGINHMKRHGGEDPGEHEYYIVINAKRYEKGIETHVTSDEEPCELVWDISGYDYDTFSATVGKAVSNNGGVGKHAQFHVYVDGELKAESPVLSNIEDYYIEADIKGGKELKLTVDAADDGYAYDDVAWGNPVIFNKDDVKIEKVELKGVSYVSATGQDLDLDYAYGLVTYDSGAEKQVPVSELEILNFYKDIEGLQTVTVKYGGATGMLEHYVSPNAGFKYVCELDWDSYVMLNGSSEELLAANEPRIDTLESEEYPIATGGTYYKHGLWCHPTDDASTNGYAEIVYDIGGHGYTNLHGIVGKANDTYCYLGQYHIYVDGALKASSPVLYAGETWEYNVDITGAQTISLAITGGEESDFGGFYWWDSTAWADPIVFKSIGAADVPAPVVEEPAVEEPVVEEPTYSYPASGESGNSLVGTVIGNAEGWGGNAAAGAAAAFDGNPATFFDPLGQGDGYCGMDMGRKVVLEKVAILSRHVDADWNSRFKGAEIRGNNVDDVNTAVTLWKSDIEGTAPDYYVVTDFENNDGYQYYFYYNTENHGDVAEVEFYGTDYVEPEVVEEPAVEEPAEEVKEEKSPNTFDFGIIAAVAAVMSLAGFTLSKKKIAER